MKALKASKIPSIRFSDHDVYKYIVYMCEYIDRY